MFGMKRLNLMMCPITLYVFYLIPSTLNPYREFRVTGANSIPSESPLTSFGGASDDTQPCNIFEIPFPEPVDNPAMLANEEPAAAIVPEPAEPAVVVPEPAAETAAAVVPQPAATELPEQEFTDSEEASGCKSLSFDIRI